MIAAPLLALPGTLLDARSLAALLAELLPGPPPATLILGQADTLDDEVDRLAASTDVPAIWLGHSLGGIVALHLAMRHPGRVAALVLLASNARAGGDSGEKRRAAQWALAQRQGLAALARSKLAPGYGLNPGSDDDEALLVSLAAQASAVGMPRFERQLAYARQRPGLLSPRHGLHCPVLAISGQADTLCPPAHSQEIVSLVQAPGHAEHQILASAGHLFPMQQPHRAAGLVRGFLAALGPASCSKATRSPIATCSVHIRR